MVNLNKNGRFSIETGNISIEMGKNGRFVSIEMGGNSRFRCIPSWSE